MINESGQYVIENVLRKRSPLAHSAILSTQKLFIGQPFADPFRDEYIRNVMIDGKIIAVLIQPYVAAPEPQQEFLSIHFYSPVTGKWELFPGWTYTAPGSELYAIHESGATFRLWYKD